MTRSTVALSTRCLVGDGDADVVLVDGAAEVDVGVAAGVPPPDDPLQAEQTRTSNEAAVLAVEGLIPRASMAKGQIATARLQP
jgi:hypothetical protein